ncbi:MAG: hypothetical protein ACYDEE_14795 [Ignavibacteriaceae bacterium]
MTALCMGFLLPSVVEMTNSNVSYRRIRRGGLDWPAPYAGRYPMRDMRYQRYLWDFFLLQTGKNLRGLGKPRRFKFGRRNYRSIYKIIRNKEYHESEPRTTN